MAFFDRVEVAGFDFDVATQNDIIKVSQEAIKNNDNIFVHTVNVDHIIIALKDYTFAEVMRNADIVTADGMPIVILSKIIGRALPERVTGADLVIKFFELSSKLDFRIFILGAAPGVAEEAKRKAELRWPGVKIVGTYSPTADEIASEKGSYRIINKINNSGANVLLVALGAPKQEKWIYKHKHVLKTNINIGVGAAIDFVAGKQKRAPVWIRNIGLEWFYRFINDPKRMFKRYIINDSKFAYIFIKCVMRNMLNKN